MSRNQREGEEPEAIMVFIGCCDDGDGGKQIAVRAKHENAREWVESQTPPGHWVDDKSAQDKFRSTAGVEQGTVMLASLADAKALVVETDNEE